MIYTSRYFNPMLKKWSEHLFTVVRISVGFPRFLSYKLDGSIRELAPKGLIGIEDPSLFRQRYFEKLDYLGVDRISSLLAPFVSEDKDTVLCCYEDIRRGSDYWCHRTMFADWWFQQTGIVIPELFDPSLVKSQ